MSRLLHAGFAKLGKSKIFYCGMAVMFFYSMIAIFSTYGSKMRYPNEAHPFTDMTFAGGPMLLIVVAVFIGIFIGTEYSDGTIRNKVIVGHSRWAIYFSNLIVCTVASISMHLVFIVSELIVGKIVLDESAIRARIILQYAMCSIITVTALAAICLLISMLVQNKASGAVMVTVLSFALLMGAAMINNKLSAPKYFESYAYMDDEGKIHEEPRTRNVNYLTGTKRKIYEFLWDFLPSCQFLQIGEQGMERKDFGRLPLYALFLVVITTSCGMIVFCRKDLK
ncbi:MAG: ABC transporter permease subunit [Lachnospiraceae bacterium]|nr:ABC transporter permease subunit [Lachnospiraceae bacterium]